ncbi:hypothetical protein GCM10027294_20280 [Marinactinospora endophytica]
MNPRCPGAMATPWWQGEEETAVPENRFRLRGIVPGTSLDLDIPGCIHPYTVDWPCGRYCPERMGSAWAPQPSRTL